MKKTLAIVLCISMLLGMLSMLSFADTATVVEKGSDWEYLVYEDTAATAPEGWATGADSETWETAPAPFSGTSWTNPNAVTVLPYGSFKSFIRQDFTIEDASKVVDAKLSITYDEDPIVYINGTQVWSATGYHDSSYVDVDLEAYISEFKSGTNTIAVAWGNAVNGGGALMDLQLDVVTGEKPVINEDGTVVITSTEEYNGAGEACSNPWGTIGCTANLYDGNQDSVWGWTKDIGMYCIANFEGEVKVTEIYLSTKNEGSMTDNTDAHGTYKLEALVDGEWVEVGTADALIEGTTVTANVEATALKVTITEWINNNWSCIAELSIKGEEIEGGNVTPPVDPVDPPVDPVDPPVDPVDPPVVETKGNVTDTITWEIVDNVLTIDGTGEMPDFTVGEGNDTRPYAEYATTVTKVIVKGGVTKTGGRSFQGFSSMTELVLEEGVTTIAQDLASSCPALETLTIPASVTSIGQGIVFGTDNIKTVNYGGADQATFEELTKANPYNYGLDEGTGGFAKVTNWVYNYTAEPAEPVTGDATVYAIVFAVVALMGMGVVVTKKVHA